MSDTLEPPQHILDMMAEQSYLKHEKDILERDPMTTVQEMIDINSKLEVVSNQLFG